MLLRCLCLILMLLMAGSPRQRIEPFGSRSWWGSEASSKFTQVAYQRWKTRDFTGAAEVYEQGYEAALRHRDIFPRKKRYLNSIAGCRLLQMRYREALERICGRGHSRLRSAIARNSEPLRLYLSSLYMQGWDFDAALAAANEGRAIVSTLGPALLQSAVAPAAWSLHQVLVDQDPVEFFAEGIEAARAQDEVSFEAEGLRSPRRGLARERAAPRCGRRLVRSTASAPTCGLRASFHSLMRVLAGSSWFKATCPAPPISRSALSLPEKLGNTFPEYLLKHQRGKIRTLQGDRIGAASGLRRSGSHWPRDGSWKSCVGFFSNGGRTSPWSGTRSPPTLRRAADEAIRSGSQHWSAEAFRAVELSRAASLRESLALVDVWRKKLRPEYWAIRTNSARSKRAC